MKILCVSDHPDPIVYSDNIRRRFADIDLVISCGDLPFSYYDFIMSNLNKPLLFVFGNHNLAKLHYFERVRNNTVLLPMHKPYDEARPTGMIHVDGRVRKIKNLLIAGLGGSRIYNYGPHQFSESKMYFRIIKLIPRLVINKIFFGRFLDILVTHAPPAGIHDQPDPCHQGFHAFLWFIRTFKPKYLLHGHIHLYDQNARRSTNHEETAVVNTYNHTVITIEDKTR